MSLLDRDSITELILGDSTLIPGFDDLEDQLEPN